MMSLSDDKQADVIDAFNTTSRYLDGILNINNVYFDNMVSQIYPSELQLNKANASDTEAAFLDLHLSISNDIVSTKIYDKRDDFDFEIVNFPFLDGDVPRSTSYGVYISQLIRFARASSYVADFNTRNKLLTQKLLKQGYRYHKLRKTFSKFYFVCLFVCFCCFTSHVNSYGHCGTVSSLNHTFSWAGLSKRLTSNLCPYFRL